MTNFKLENIIIQELKINKYHKKNLPLPFFSNITLQDNLQNYDLLNELQNKLRDVEEEKKMLEREISDGKRSLKDLERRLERSQEEITDLRRK